MRQEEVRRLHAARNKLAQAFSDGESTDFIAGLVELDELLGLDTTEARKWLDALGNARSVSVSQLAQGDHSFTLDEE